ncbi:acetylxylan esterase [Spirosoma sp. KCTC 42546]|uniref:acetylxylan esterase n=1 Tax=Spirosoma sp. KCTC 42546 TaxID=2520506 RepID=UPI001158BADB|nr:acetylxylan esterase [Spirosoma sp. KCTC 42546]QDK79827.1 acetylxylan esterase [Spirosoma sp. KCTC 42546]
MAARVDLVIVLPGNFSIQPKITIYTAIGYEQLTSQVAITAIVGDFGYPTPANGQGNLQNQYLNLNPFVGKRFGNERFSIDATVGLDIAVGLLSREFGKVQPEYPFLQMSDQRRPIPDVDLRPRLNLTGYYRMFGLSAGYSHGLSNYAGKQLSTDALIYAHFWRVGIAYRFGKHT